MANFPGSDELARSLEHLREHAKIPILGDVTSNLHRVNGVIKHIEIILGQDESRLISLKPDLLVTFGGSIHFKKPETISEKGCAIQSLAYPRIGLPS